MTELQIKAWKYLKENANNFDSCNPYCPSTTSYDFYNLDETTPKEKCYFTIHKNNVFDCESGCSERIGYDFDGEEYTYYACGEEGECNAIWYEEVIICEDGTINYNGKLYTFENIDSFLNDY